MSEYKRYYCQIKVDAHLHMCGDDPLYNIRNLNERIENVLEQWSIEMSEKGLNTDIVWNWSEHCNI